jgi:hypothetical protein
VRSTSPRFPNRGQRFASSSMNSSSRSVADDVVLPAGFAVARGRDELRHDATKYRLSRAGVAARSRLLVEIAHAPWRELVGSVDVAAGRGA